MSGKGANIVKLNLSDVSNEAIISSEGCKTSTPRSKSDNVKQTMETANKKPISTGRKCTTGKNNKSAPRRRSLTMTDIRNKVPAPISFRTPLKNMKQDSCSTSDYSPRLSNEHPAEVMMTIRRRELQIRTFAKMFYNLWRKQKNLVDHFKNEADQKQVQISFLVKIRDSETESRNNITNLAEMQKTEIIDLNQKISQFVKDQDILQYICNNLQQEYNKSVEYIQNSSTNLDIACEENQQILTKVKEAGDLMDAHFIGLKRTLRTVEEINNRVQYYLATYNAMQQSHIEAINTLEKFAKTNKSLREKLKTKEENNKNLQETIKDLRNSLENSTAQSSDLKCQIKNIKLQLEFAELQLKEKEYRPNPWSAIARKAVRFSMYILYQVGLFPAF